MPSGRTRQIGIGGWLVLALTTQHLTAQTHEGYLPESAAAIPGHAVPIPGPEVYGPTGMDQMRQYPHPGPEWAATHGYPNYDLRNRFFDVWFRSQAWGLTKRERCAFPDPWMPRGYGNLFARPVTSHRMDYHRHVLVDRLSGYGPSYYVRHPDPRCCVRDCEGHCYYHRTRAAERAMEDCHD